ncbi:MAG: hypothetical protein K6G27_05700 [Lachnospiraceae bacterium]|nr:hypothetical protein [Lachnospiraceae bacterium]
MFINFSYTSYKEWPEDQIKAAREYGEIVDFLFPEVSADADETEIEEMADECGREIYEALEECGTDANAVLVEGEYTLTFSLVNRLKELNIGALSAGLEKHDMESTDSNGNKIKESYYIFKRFREY